MILLSTLVLAAPALTAAPLGDDFSPCERIARLAARAAFQEAGEDLLIHLANCLNIADAGDAAACLLEAHEAAAETAEEALEIFEARMELCDDLDEELYDPVIDPEDFVEGISNAYQPFTLGSTWNYRKEFEEDGERIVEIIDIEVLEETREIMGVECTIVRDTVHIDGELVEDTFDYFAQDVDGNVWYFGEISMNYEDGFLTDLDGSWIGGDDFAKPGILMFAEPMVGRTYRLEWYLDEAEDAAVFLSDSEEVSVPAGDFRDCRLIQDFTPLEPDADEHKYFAPGVGLVLEVDLETGEELVLMAYDVKKPR